MICIILFLLFGFCVFYYFKKENRIIKKSESKNLRFYVNNIDNGNSNYQIVPEDDVFVVDSEYPIYERCDKINNHVYFFMDYILKVNKVTKDEHIIKSGGYEERLVKKLRNNEYPKIPYSEKYDVYVEFSH